MTLPRTLTVAGKNVIRRDLDEKVTGSAKYSADLKLPGMLYGRVLRSSHPHANILSVDTTEATQLPGVLAIVTPFDAPEGRLAPDTLVLDTRVRFVGDEVAAVAAVDNDTAQHALELLRVEYEILSFVLDADEALLPGAVEIHPGGNLAGAGHLSFERGDVEKGFAQADLILEEEYVIPAHSATPMEPRAALASWEGDGLTVWKSSRGVHVDRQSLAQALGIPLENVRVVGPPMGGGFGNKDESRMAALCAVLSQRAGMPVRIEYSREEEFIAGRVRHAGRLVAKVGLKQDGSITAVYTDATLNTGAYLSSGSNVARRAGQAALYLYHSANAKYEARLAYTNRPVAGSYRALGAPQGHFALETLMDRAAEALNMDPLEFRLKNRVRAEGQPGNRATPPDQIIDPQPVEGGIPFSSYGLEECLVRGSKAFGWNEPKTPEIDPSSRVGRGMSMIIYRGGPGAESRAQVSIDTSGKVALATGLIEVGEGVSTVLAQMAAEVLGVAYEDVDVIFADTQTTPAAPFVSGSTATFSTGTAVVDAATQVRDQLLAAASAGLETPVNELDCGDGIVFVKARPENRMKLADVAALMEPDHLHALATITPGSKDYIINSFGAHFTEVAVDTETGRVQVLRYVAAHDSGRIMNPNAALSQVEGAVSQMLGFALWEELVTDGPTGVTLNANYLDHKVTTILDCPDIQVIFADIVDPIGPLGAKALGEVPCPGVAPAIANAIYDAIGVRFNRLPITPARILKALNTQ